MDSTLACLAAWMPRQRWYAAKARRPSLRLVAWWDLPSADPGARVRTYLVVDEGSLPSVMYQVPVVARETASLEAHPDHVIGSPEPGTTFVDGPFDPAFTSALLDLLLGSGVATGPRSRAVGAADVSLSPTALPDAGVLTGEQSNTSLIYRGADAMPVICKLYRQVNPGLSPDIELASALATAGSTHVPRAVGSIDGAWPDPDTAAGTITGSLAFAQEFLPGVEDAWRVALRAASRGEDFRARADALGVATAEVHVLLAALFPTAASDDGARAAIAATWQRRLSIAIAEVPEIARRRGEIDAVYARALAAPWPDAQRIHGDYHLGQVLQVPDRGWVLLDFEGEPLRPIAERILPDLALRDVAGMLRSFDYVAGSLRLDAPDGTRDRAAAWAAEARRAFLDGYARTTDAALDVDGALLTALELDKAVYEAIYESRNRPTWVSIPLRAISRLVERAESVSG